MLKNKVSHPTRHGQNKLIISNVLNDLLLELYDKDVIAYKIINDSKKDYIQTNISWLNLTNNNNFLSYSTPIDSKKQDGPWSKKNRKTSQIRKIIKKIYKRQFSNKQIKTFVSKFIKKYSEFKLNQELKEELKKNRYDDDKIMYNIISYTEKNYIEWKNVDDSLNNIIKFYTLFYITKNKYINLKLYHFEDNIKNSFLILSLKDNKEIKPIFRRFLRDADGIWLLYDIIKNKKDYK